MNDLNTTDEALLGEFASGGSQPAFRALTDRYAGMVHAVGLRRTGNRQLAEEVAQNVFAVVARKAASLARPGVRLAPWLHRAALLESTRAMRKEAIRQRIMDDYSHHADALAEPGGAMWQAVLPELDGALDSLPARDRQLVFARFFDGRSYRELALSTGKSEAALMQQHHRAIEKLSGWFERRGIRVTATALAAVLGSTLTQAAPGGMAAALAASAPVAAGSVGAAALVVHSLEILMHTKSRLLIASALGLCLLAGGGAFWNGKTRAEARLAGWAYPMGAIPDSAGSLPVVDAAVATGVAAPAGVRAKLEAAAAGWRAGSGFAERIRALEVLDALRPDEVPEAVVFLESVSSERGLFLELGKRIARLWGAGEPEPALRWLVGALPREHCSDPMQAILDGWSHRDPGAALNWWQGVMDSLEFPIAEDAFERFGLVIYEGWAAHDPAGLAATLPPSDRVGMIDGSADATVHAKVMGLAAAAIDRTTRSATLAAVGSIPDEPTRAAVAATTAVMMELSDPGSGREFAPTVEFSEPERRAEMLVATTFGMLQTGQQSATGAIAWLRSHADDAITSQAIEAALEEAAAEAGVLDDSTAAAVRAALGHR